MEGAAHVRRSADKFSDWCQVVAERRGAVNVRCRKSTRTADDGSRKVSMWHAARHGLQAITTNYPTLRESRSVINRLATKLSSRLQAICACGTLFEEVTWSRKNLCTKLAKLTCGFRMPNGESGVCGWLRRTAVRHLFLAHIFGSFWELSRLCQRRSRLGSGEMW